MTALSDKSVTVETTDKKNVDVALVDTTTYEKDKKAAARDDLKIGDRVDIHAVMVKGILEALTEQFSEPVSPPAR